MPDVEILEATIPMNAGGMRFDAALAQAFPQFSRSKLTAWLKDGKVEVDGRPPRPRDAARGGERVRLHAEVETVTVDAPEDIALDVLIEDPDFYVLNKPAGLVVHPGAGNRSGTLVNALLHKDPALAALPRGSRSLPASSTTRPQRCRSGARRWGSRPRAGGGGSATRPRAAASPG